MNQDPKLNAYIIYLEANGGEYAKNWIYEILKVIIIIIIELAVSSCTNLSKSEI